MSTLFPKTWNATRRTSSNVMGEVQYTSAPFTLIMMDSLRGSGVKSCVPFAMRTL